MQEFTNPRALARAMAKVTGLERGAAGVIARLVAHGAPHPDTVTEAELVARFGRPAPDFTPAVMRRLWLRLALQAVGARRVSHPGNHRFCGQSSRVATLLMTLPGQ